MDIDTYTPDFHDLTDESGFVKDTSDSIIKVIGVGGGGSNAVNYMYAQKIPHVNFVVCNTDAQHLEKSPVPNKLLIGKEITNGLGAGNVPDVGRQCAEASADKIKELFDSKTEMVFITAGMGGGTGTGAAPVVAQLAKEAGMLTIGIVTVPFFFEGEKKILKAIEGAKEMKKHVDALLVINNENLIDLYKDLDFFNAFGKADDTLANAARSISEIISEPCYINVDFQDVKTTLKEAGTAIISTAEGEGEHRISKAIDKALHSPLLKTHDIYSSKRILLKVVCWKDSPNSLKMEEMSEINQFTSQLPPNIDVKWGIGDNPRMGDKVKITVLASGFDMTLKESDTVCVKPVTPGGDKKGPIMLVSDEDQPTGEKALQDKIKQMEVQETMGTIYGHEKIKEKNRASDEIRYVVLKPSQFDDLDVIAMLENHKAFNRAPGFKDEINKIGQTEQKPHLTDPRDLDRGAAPITF
jgi:cell division protein ftsZ